MLNSIYTYFPFSPSHRDAGIGVLEQETTILNYAKFYIFLQKNRKEIINLPSRM